MNRRKPIGGPCRRAYRLGSIYRYKPKVYLAQVALIDLKATCRQCVRTIRALYLRYLKKGWADKTVVVISNMQWTSYVNSSVYMSAKRELKKNHNRCWNCGFYHKDHFWNVKRMSRVKLRFARLFHSGIGLIKRSNCVSSEYPGLPKLCTKFRQIQCLYSRNIGFYHPICVDQKENLIRVTIIKQPRKLRNQWFGHN